MMIHTSMHALFHIHTYVLTHTNTYTLSLHVLKIGRNKTQETQKRTQSLRKEKKITLSNADFLISTKQPVDTGYQFILSLKRYFFCYSFPVAAAAASEKLCCSCCCVNNLQFLNCSQYLLSFMLFSFINMFLCGFIFYDTAQDKAINPVFRPI